MSVSFDTTVGRFTIDLFYVDNPKGCLNFMKLCKMKYYNFSLFHTVQHNFIAQAGDPTGTGKGGQSVFGLLYGEQAKYFEAELPPNRKHKSIGTVSLVNCGDKKFGSQFFITLAENLDSLDEEHCVIGQVMTGLDVIKKLNETICDKENRPYQDVRVTHTVILDDPFPDPEGFLAPDRSPEPTREILQGGRIAPDEDINEFADRSQEEIEEYIKEKESKAQATILEMIGDLPSVDVAPPENVLFVCKLNPVTTEDDLAIIFGRFGNIVSCEVIRDRESDKSLQYGFIEFDNPKSAEEAYFKMNNCLVDDRRIHVDFSQSVAHLKWRGKGKGGYAENFDQDKFIEKSKRSKDRDKTKRKSEERRKRSSEDRQRKSSEDRQRKSSEEREKSPNLTIKKPSRRSIRRRSESNENGRSLSRSPQKRRRSPSEHRRSPSYRRRRSPPRRSPPRQWRNDRYWNGGRRGRSPAYNRNMNDWRRSRRSPVWRERPTRYWDDRDRYDRDNRRRRSSERDYDRRRSTERVRKSPELESRRRSESRHSKSRSITPDIKKRKYTESSKKKRRETSSESEKSVERSPNHVKGRRSRSKSVRKERSSTPVVAPIVEMTYDKFGFLGRKMPVETEKKEMSARERSREKKRSRSRKRSVSRRKTPEIRKKSLEPNVDKRRRRGSTPEGRRRRSPSREKVRRRSRSRNRSVTPPRKRVATPEKTKKAESVKERRKKVETETEESSAESNAGEVRKKKKKKAKAKKKKSRKGASSSESSQEADSDSAESESGGEERKKKKKSKKKKSKK